MLFANHAALSYLDIPSKTRYLAKALVYFPLLLGLFGCGGTGQDQGQVTTQPQAISGLAIDGYLARSLVFIDYDNNRTRDPWEPYAFTDDDGYFSFNRLTNTNYCSASASEHNELFCLRTNRNLDDAVIRIDGGYDVMTGEPFYGQLSRRLATGAFNEDDVLIVSPITSLLTDVRSPNARNTIVSALGLSERDLDEDYLNATNGGVNAHLLNTALKLHKTISAISQAAGRSYSELGSKPGAMNDASATVYKHLANQLVNGNHRLDDIIANQAFIGQIIAGTELDILDYYDRWEIPIQTYQSVAIDPSPITDEITGVTQLINALIIQGDTINNIGTVIGSVKLIEAMTIKAGSDPVTRATLRDSINMLLDPQNQALRNDLIAALAAANSDLAAVARLNLADPTLNSTDAVHRASHLPAGIMPFHHLAGHQLKVSDMDLGSAPNHLRDSEVEFYFQGNESDTHGSFSACVKYIKDASLNGKLGDANTRGELVKGHWSLLGASQNHGGSYSLLLTIDFLGTRYQAILKPAGRASFDGEEMQGIRFDYGNELRNWHTKSGLEPVQFFPTTAADCANRLPSRVGL